MSESFNHLLKQNTDSFRKGEVFMSESFNVTQA